MRKSLLAAVLSLALVGQAAATPWHDLGPRAMAMGGTGVAMAQGPLASYWNPAGLGQQYGTSGLIFPAVGIRFEATGTVLEGANDINEINKACERTDATICTTANLTDALNRFGEPGNGAMVDFGSSLAYRHSPWRATFFVQNLTYIGVRPSVDPNGVVVNGTTIANDSAIHLRGGNFTEIGVGYAHEIMETGLVFGLNLKGIIGRTGFAAIILKNQDTGNGGFGDFDNNTASSFQPGIDAGVLWDMRETFDGIPMRPRIGIVGRNLNNPKFTNPGAATLVGEPSKLSVQGQARAGFALSPMKFWHLSADFDLTENLTLIDGFNTRYAGVGTEINLINRPRFNLPFRAGIKKNLANTASGVSYTAGLGLNFFHFTIDIAGQISTKRTSIQTKGTSEKIPNSAAASLQLGFLFGNKDEGAR
ncbi:MAG: hypothetical protein COB53_01375 [Elusimicrobia bacterium]|nr:MAG: hypothetical protein COB53_01375 [Elusimicrobiota bacterium]